MAKRAKKTAAPEGEQTDIEKAIEAVSPAAAPPEAQTKADELIAEHFKIDDFLKGQEKAFADAMKQYRERDETIKNELLKLHHDIGVNSISTDNGTAYISVIMNTKIDADAPPYQRSDSPTPSFGREAVLDFALDNWEEFGNEGLSIGVTKDAVKKYMEEHNGTPPPGVTISHISRLNIRRS